MYYAQIDPITRICFAMTETHSVIDDPHMIEIPDFTVSVRGKVHNAETGEWSDQPPAPLPRHITQLAFLSRFTDAEAIAIDLASIGATVQAASMRRYMSKVTASTYIDLDRADTRAGVEAMEAGGFLTVGRAAVILDAAISDHERYKG